MIKLTNKAVVETASVELPDGSIAQEFALPSGTARVRVVSVPPMLISETLAGMPELADPPLPMVRSEGKFPKSLPAREGQEEWNEWALERERIKKLRDEFHSDKTWNFGVVEWKRPMDAEEWVSEPPKAWKFPERMKTLGKKPREGKEGRRVDYIKYVLVAAAVDMEAVQMAMFSMTEPIQPGEVQAISDLFLGEEGRETDS